MRRSRIGTAFVAIASFASLAILLVGPGEVAWRVGAAAWCAAVAIPALIRQRGGTSLELEGQRIKVNGVAGGVVSGSFVAPWLTIVHWRPPDAWVTRTVLVLPDMADAERLRRLRVILKWA